MILPHAFFARLLYRLFPLRANPKFAHLSLADLRRRYRAWDHAGVGAFLLLVPPCIYGLHELFVAYTESGPRQPGIYELRPGTIFWYAPAALLGCGLATLVVHLLYRALLRERSEEYRHYYNLSAGINASRMYLAVGLVYGAAFLALAFFASQSRLRLTDNEIIIRRLWSIDEERYPYARVVALKEMRDKKDHETFVIQFDDAPDWSTKVEVIFPGEQEKQFLSQRTGKRIERFVANEVP